MSQAQWRASTAGAAPRARVHQHFHRAGRGRALTVALSALLAGGAAPAAAQQQNHANWELAKRFSTEALRQIVHSTSVGANWIEKTDSLWYNWEDPSGATFYLVIPKTHTKRPLFDHAKLAAALSMQGGKPYDATKLPFNTIEFTKDLRSIRFLIDSTRYEWNLRTETLQNLGIVPRDSLALLRRPPRFNRFRGRFNRDFRNYSPDSTAFAFARDHNLFVVEVATGDTLQVSTDGVEDYSFGARDTTRNQQQNQQFGRGRGGRPGDPRVRANVEWSPDSRAFAVTRNDERKVGELYLVNVLAEPRPTLVKYRYAMPGEENVPQQELYVYRRGEKAIVPVSVARWKDQRLFNIHWTTGHDLLRLVRRDRLQRHEELIEVDLRSDSITPLLADSVEDATLERENVQYVRAAGDFIWWSERTGWGQFYLYDHDGHLKNAITSGPWRAENIEAVDSVKRVLWFTAVGKEPGEDVYYQHLYRVNLDGSGLTLLNPGDADHNASLSPSHQYILDNYSRVDEAPEAVLRDGGGRVIMDLEKFDTKPLAEMGWRPPEPFVVKAADGVTDIYGNLWKPFDFDSTKSYPIIANVYPGPQTENVSSTFVPTASQQELAQLGFIVIQIGNRGGSPHRSNAYHSYGYYNLRDYGLADKKAGIEQLAAQHHWIDINRVGIYGHSGGGFMTAAAMMLPPYNDFFKVGVSSSGNHDNNVYNQNWSEEYHGLKEVVVRPDSARRGRRARAGTDGAAAQAQDTVTRFEIHVPTNAELAKNLKGNLLLVHGDMDNNVHPAGTIRLINELIKANKRFDFMIMPGKPHAYGDFQPYFNHMMFEYFAEHLLGDYYRSNAEISN